MRARGRLLKLCCGCGLLLLGVVTNPGDAYADGRVGNHVDAFVDDTNEPTATASEGVAAPGSESAAGGSKECTWHVVIEDDTETAVHSVDGERQFSETGRWLERRCDGVPVPVGGRMAVPEGDPQSVDPVALAARARESVAIPSPRIATSPSADERLYVRVPTWLWLEGDVWRTHEATASAGRVSSTVRAEPVRTVWDMGDGSQVVCDGPGVAWEEGMEEDDTDCSYEYVHSSAGQPEGTYTLSVRVEFSVSWSSNVGRGGELPGVTRSASRPVEVGEVQAVQTR